MSDQPRTVVFAGGGTGGHLFPALAIAERLPADWRRLYLCSSRSIDSTILTKEGVDFLPLPAIPPSRKKLLAFTHAFTQSYRDAKGALRDAAARGPVSVVAMGGFVCPPAALAARSLRIPVTLVNLDAEPGKANRFVDRVAARVFTAADGPAVPARWARIGPILRRSVLVNATRGKSRAALGLDPNLHTLFVSGGSQGAGTINEAMRALVERDPALFQAGGGWQVFHQAGGATSDDDAHLVALRTAYQNGGVRAKVVAFCDQMGHAWNAADLALCRGGAGTIAEALGTGTPAVVLPYPHHGDEHQRKNAQFLADAGGAIILTDHADALKTLPALRDTLIPLLRDRTARDAMRDALIALAPMDGAGTVAANLA